VPLPSSSTTIRGPSVRWRLGDWIGPMAWRLSGTSRARRNDFRIQGRGMSSESDAATSLHCEINVRADAVILRDPGSTNGTFVDSDPP